MAAAQDSATTQKVDLWIGGESVSPGSNKYFDSLNPLWRRPVSYTHLRAHET